MPLQFLKNRSLPLRRVFHPLVVDAGVPLRARGRCRRMHGRSAEQKKRWPIHCGAAIVPHLAVTFCPAPPSLATSPSPPRPGHPLTARQGSPRASTYVRSPAMPRLRAAVLPPSSPPPSSFAAAELLPRRRAPSP